MKDVDYASWYNFAALIIVKWIVAAKPQYPSIIADYPAATCRRISLIFSFFRRSAF